MFRSLIRRPGAARLLLVAFATLFVGSLVLTPHLNPFSRGRVLAITAIDRVWGDVMDVRRKLMDVQQIEGDWPADITPYLPPADRSSVRIESPAPHRLVVTVVDQDEMGSLAGTQMILDFDRQMNTSSCRPGSPPFPQGYLPLNCQEADKARVPIIDTLHAVVIACGVLFAVATLLLLLRHPLLMPVQMRPSRLLRLPVGQLIRLDRLLGLLGRRESTLMAAGTNVGRWRQALTYARGTASQRLGALALRLGAEYRPSSGWSLPGVMGEWLFKGELPVSMDRCLVYLPEPELADELLLQHLRAQQTGLDVMLVVREEAGEALRDHCADPANLLVLVDGAAQTELLLAARPTEVLLRLLAAQLRVTRISPYQTRGGVVRPGSFFGRAQMLARVLNREPANYLVVGGRQLGKSSLLKAVQRRLQDHPHLACHYVSLRDHRLAPRLALQFGLPAETALEQVVEHLAAQCVGKRLFLLIDEADLFFRDEAQHGYGQLSTLRALSEEGRCWFMLAGFWDLYATAVLDYQSPLRNFGEVLTVGALEVEACRELARVPLELLRLGFANDSLIEDLVEASGRRANLVAILCQECLEGLQPGERAIERRHLQAAISSQAVRDALAGWGRLSHDERACRLDRILVYQVACNGAVRLADLVERFRGRGVRVEADELQRSLSRLLLAYVLQREAGAYGFAVPLLAHQFDVAETRVLLEQEFEALALHPV
ncbi:AAA family ATPase [Metapseudomonas otitidis]|uniref:AAA family ATPase n=1 Tax=Metapseudomonas otitidis TaxID=319939 RepID=UPI000D1A8A73|nr:AAA family ATPase [Pseudomonas otitidis]